MLVCATYDLQVICTFEMSSRGGITTAFSLSLSAPECWAGAIVHHVIQSDKTCEGQYEFVLVQVVPMIGVGTGVSVNLKNPTRESQANRNESRSRHAINLRWRTLEILAADDDGNRSSFFIPIGDSLSPPPLGSVVARGKWQK
jgi:hypothetical protein